MIGKTLSHFEITAKLGEGGMGEVYRAEDTNLGREVAIKLLPEAVSTDPERLARFEREARVLASINHSNIAAVYSFESSEDGVAYLVMELVEGEDLKERLDHGPIAVEETLHLARQIAEALEAAHEHGIVHRDLKPANVKVKPDGQVKVLDFGLAKALAPPQPGPTSPTFSQSPTLTAEVTSPGIVLGTAAYMSPEQAKGLEADRFSDIWSFGVLLWEMLTGERLFKGETVAEILAAVLRDKAELGNLPKDTPVATRNLISRCLDRDCRMRLRDIGEARIALSRPDEDTPGVTPASDAEVPTRNRARWVLAGVLSALAVSVLFLVLRPTKPPTGPLRRSAIESPEGVILRPRSGFALSPDGLQLAFVGRDTDGVLKLWVRSLTSGQSRALDGAEEAWAPFWSPDGRHIAFFDYESKQLKRIPATGGVSQILADETTEPKGGSWSSDGRIVYTPDYRSGLFEVPAGGGTPRALTELDTDQGELSHRWPRFLPDDRSLLFLVQTAEAGAEIDRSRLEIRDRSGARHEILRGNSSAEYADPGYLLFWRENSVYGQELDLSRLRIGDEPILIADGVGLTINEWSTFTASKEGTLVYHAAASVPWRLEWRDRAGNLLSAATEEGDFLFPAISPEGRRVAYVADNTTIWVLDVDRGTHTRLSFEEADHYLSAWGPEGKWLAYCRDKGVEPGGLVVRRRLAGPEEEQVLYESDYVLQFLAWSPDGRWIAFEENEDILLLDLETLEARKRIGTTGWDIYPSFSPDSQWLAYTSDESGRDEVYVVPVHDESRKWQISSRGGIEPEWGPTGDEIFFRGLDFELHVVAIDLSAGEPEFGVPTPLFSEPGARPGFMFAIGPNGRILVRIQPSANEVENFGLVQNWPALLNPTTR